MSKVRYIPYHMVPIGSESMYRMQYVYNLQLHTLSLLTYMLLNYWYIPLHSVSIGSECVVPNEGVYIPLF